MKAIEISAPGGPEVLRLVERPAPTPGPGELLVRVEAAGVNRPDILQRMGKYPPPPGVSDMPGLEIAGTVAAIGPRRRRWREGDNVCALVAGGGYAEYCVVPEPQALPLPRRLPAARGRGCSRDVLHRLDQPVRSRQARRGRDGPDSRRLERHRHDRHPARAGIRRHGACHRRLGRQVRRLRAARRRGPSTTAPRTSFRRSASRLAATASTSSSTSSAATISRATSSAWRCTAAWSRSV